MENKIKVVITGADFVSSNFTDIYNCALSKALKRKLGSNTFIMVGSVTVDIKNSTYVIDSNSRREIQVRCNNDINEDLEVTLIKRGYE